MGPVAKRWACPGGGALARSARRHERFGTPRRLRFCGQATLSRKRRRGEDKSVSSEGNLFPPWGDKPVRSVSELTGEVKTLLEEGFTSVWVAGEISNLARPSSGHLYFSL